MVGFGDVARPIAQKVEARGTVARFGGTKAPRGQGTDLWWHWRARDRRLRDRESIPAMRLI